MPREYGDDEPCGDQERRGSYAQEEGYGARLGGTRSGSRSRSRSPGRRRRRRPAAEDFYRVRSPAGHHDDGVEEGEGGSRSQSHRHRHRHHLRDVAAGSSSRSPPLPEEEEEEDRKKHHRRRRHHHHHRDKPKTAHSSSTTTTAAPARETPAQLPYDARPLSYKHDLAAFTPLFAYYLDVQKNLDFYGLDGHEARGRWKSFVHKWNGGVLAEGWYDPEMFERITREAAEAGPDPAAAQDDNYAGKGGYGGGAEQGDWRQEEEEEERGRLFGDNGDEQRPAPNNNEGDDDDEDYGPPPPPPGQYSSSSHNGTRKGPVIPTLADIALQRESAAEERSSQLEDLRAARRADRAEQKERLEELVPRAEPGTRERRLEKRAAVNEKMKGFREGGGGGEVEEVGDGDLMGGGDSVSDLKRAKAAMQRKKTERELRREAEARAREEERLARLKEWREREEEKLRGLKELARARFG
jgi:hypothetical protein